MPDDAAAQRAHAAVTMTELFTVVEELQVAEEELRVQSEALTTTRAELEHERERYKELFDFAPDAYVVTDDRGVVVEANIAASTLFGIPARYLVGKPVAAFVDGKARMAFRQQLDCLCGARSSGQWTMEIRRRDGSVITTSVRATVSSKAAGTPRLIRWLIRDDTERSRGEQRLARRVDELERQLAALRGEFPAAPSSAPPLPSDDRSDSSPG